MTPELKAAINTLLVAAEVAANHWQTASAVALPLRAAIDEMKNALLPPITDDDIIRMFPTRIADELSDMADRLAESRYSHSGRAHQ